ncbi:MAG: hypothetical protein PQJ60_12770, partial [Spirochaetales bacterium]|nr:hypothetical protein [Spirochaetales bacterium]
MSSQRIRRYLLFFAFLFTSYLSAQSRIPGDSSNWLQTSNGVGLGGTDPVMVVLFEVPSDFSGDIYFGICDPEGSSTSPDQNMDAETYGTYVTYTLFGGDGCYTDDSVSSLSYGSEITATGHLDAGTALESLTYDETGTELISGTKNVTPDGEWVYFDRVNASDGELVGSNRYFRIVADAYTYANDNTLNIDEFKNAFQLIASYTNGTTPSEITSIRAFAYSWCVDFRDGDATTWNFYPYVPDHISSTDQMDVYIHDSDELNAYTLYDISGNVQADSFNDPLDVNTQSTWSSETNGGTDYYFGTEVNGTWQIAQPSTGAAITDNTAEVWATTVDATVETLKVYADYYKPEEADHVTATYDSTETGSFRTVTLQIVDGDGKNVPYQRSIYIENPSTTLQLYEDDETTALAAQGSSAVVTTNSDGYYVFTCDNTADETVTITFLTDGTNGSDRLPDSGTLGTNDSATLTFESGTIPTLLSGGVTLTEGDTATSISFTITENDGTFITEGNDVYIRIPDTVSATFDQTYFDTGSGLTFGGTASVDSTITYVDTKTFKIDVLSDLGSTDTITLDGLYFESDFTASSGYFELSYDGEEGSWNVADTVEIDLSGTTYFTWDGSSSTDFFTAANWEGGVAPSADDSTEKIIIESVATNDPTLDSDYSFKELIINSGGILTLDDTVTTLAVASSYENNGSLILGGTNSAITFSGDVFDADVSLGDVELNCSGTGTLNYGHFDDLTLTAGTWSSGTVTSYEIEGDVLLSGGSWNASSDTVYLFGDWNNASGSTTTVTNLDLVLEGTETSNIYGSSDFDSFVSTAGGKQIDFEASSTQTISTTLTLTGSSGNLLGLGGITDTAWTMSTSGATVDVSYVNVDYGNAGTADITCDYSTLTNVNGLGTGFDWLSSGTVHTWDAGAATDLVTDANNWDTDTVPSSGDSIIIPDVSALSNAPVLAAAWDLGTGDMVIESGGTFDTAGFALDGDELTVESGGTLTMDGGTITCGTFTSDGTLEAQDGATLAATTSYLADSGTVEYSGATGGTTLSLGDDYYDLTFTEGAWSIDAGLTVGRNLTIDGGSLDSNGQTISVAGDIDLTGNLTLDTDLTLSGDLTSSGGALTQSAGTVTLSGGTQTIEGAHTWYNLTCTTAASTIRFSDGDTQTITNNFTITGSSGNLITLTLSSGTEWLIDVGGTVSVQYGDINYSNASASGPHTATYSQTTDGGNTDWNIYSGPGTYTWEGDDGTDPTDWDVAANWDTGSVPVAGAFVTIPDTSGSGGSDPVLTGATAYLDTLTIDADATLTTDGYDLSVSGTVSNEGTLVFTGNETVTFDSGLDTDSGTVQYEDGTADGTISFTTFYHLTIAGSTYTHTVSGNTTVNGDLTVSGTMEGAAESLTVTGDSSLTGDLTFSGIADLAFNGAVSSLTGTVSTTNGTISISGTPSTDLTVTGQLYAGTGSITIDMDSAHNILGEGDGNYDLYGDTITLTAPLSLVGDSGTALETESTNDCTLTLPSGNVGIYVEHTGSVTPGFGGDRQPSLNDFPVYLTATADLTLPGNIIESGDSILTFQAGGTLTIPAACTLETVGDGGVTGTGNITLTGDTLTIAAPGTAEYISSTGTGTVSLTQSSGDFTLNKSLSTGSGDLTVDVNNGGLTVSETISSTSGGISLLANSVNTTTYTGSISLDAAVSTAGDITLSAYNGAITQSAALTADILTAITYDDDGAAVTLTNAANDANTVDLQSRDGSDTADDTGDVSYTDADGFDIDGLATAGDATLTLTSATADDGTADVTQSTAITAAGLLLQGTGDYYFDLGTNSITTLAASVTGDIFYNQGSSDVIIGTVGAVAGLTASADISLQNYTGAAYPYSYYMDGTGFINCVGLAMRGQYGNFNLTDPTASNSISTIAVYSSLSTRPVRVNLVQSGALTVGVVDVCGNSLNGIDMGETFTIDLGTNDFTIDGAVTSFDVDGDFTLTADEIIDNGITVNTAGNVTLSLSNLTPSALNNTWIFDGTTTFDVSGGNAFTLYNLQIGTASVAGDLTFTGDTSWDVDGSLTVLNGGATSLDITDETLTIAGDVDLADLDTFTSTGSSITLDGTADQSLTANGSTTAFADLTISNTAATGTEVTTSDAIETTGTLTVTNGTFTTNSTLVSGDLLTVNGGDLVTNGTLTVSSNGLTASSGSFTANSTADITGDLTISGATGETYNTLTVAGNLTISAGTLTGGDGTADTIQINNGDLTLSGTGSLDGLGYIDVNGAVEGDVSLSGTGTLDGNDRQITVEGDWSETAGVFDNSTGTSRINFDGGAASQIDTVNSIDDLYVTNDTTLTLGTALDCENIVLTNNAGTSTLDSNGSDLTASGTLSGDGTLETDGTETLDFAGNITVDTIDFTGGSPTLQAASDFTPTTLTAGSSLVQLDDANAANLAGLTYYDLEVTKSAAGVLVTAQAAVTVGNNLTLTQGDLDLDGVDLTVTGIFSNDATLYLTGAQTVSFGTADTDSGEIEFDGAGTTLATLTDFYDLTLNGSGSRTFPATLNIYGDLDASGDTGTHDSATNSTNFYFRDETGLADTGTGTYTPPATASNLTFYDLSIESGNTLTTAGYAYVDHDVTIDGALTAGADMEVAEDWANNGTFTAGTNTVEFVGSAASYLTGDSSFYNFTCDLDGDGVSKTINFADSSTQAITNALFIRGDDQTNLVILESDTAAGWTFNHSGTETVSYAAVHYGQVLGSDIDATFSVDVDLTCDTTTPGWIFGAKTVTWDGSTDTDWFTGANWDWGYIPNNTDDVIIADVTNQPSVDGNITTNSLTINTGATSTLEMQDSFGLTADGDVTINADASLILGDGSDFTFNGTTFENQGDLYREGSSTVDVSDTDSGRTIYRNAVGTGLEEYGVTDYYDLLIENAMDLASDISVAGALEITGTLDTNGNDLTVTGDTTGTGGTLAVAAGDTMDGGGSISVDTVTATGAALIYTEADFTPTNFTAGSSQVTLDGSTAASLGGLTYYDLILNKDNSTDTITSAAGLTVSNGLTMTQGIWDGESYTHSVTGGWDSSGVNFTFTADTSTVSLGAGAVSITTGEGFNDLEIAGVCTLGTALEVGGDLTIGATGDLTATASLAITVDGDWTNSGTFSGVNGTVSLEGTATQNVTFGGDSFYNLTIDGAGAVFADDGTVDNNLTLTTGTLDIDGNDLTVTGTVSNDTTLYLTGDDPQAVTDNMDTDSGTVVFDGTATTPDFAGLTTFYNLTLTDGEAREIPASLTVHGNLDVSGVTTTLDSTTNSSVITF